MLSQSPDTFDLGIKNYKQKINIAKQAWHSDVFWAKDSHFLQEMVLPKSGIPFSIVARVFRFAILWDVYSETVYVLHAEPTDSFRSVFRAMY